MVGLVTLLVQSAFYKVKDMPDVEQALKVILVISTVLMTPVVLVLSKVVLARGLFHGRKFRAREVVVLCRVHHAWSVVRLDHRLLGQLHARARTTSRTTREASPGLPACRRMCAL